MKLALLQVTSTADPYANAHMLCQGVAEAAGEGATFVATPEVSNLITPSRTEQAEAIHSMESDPVLSALQEAAQRHDVEILVGSLALRSDTDDPRYVNRSVMIGADGQIRAQYDKIHLFDVELSAQERFEESSAYQPGTEACVARTRLGLLGMSVCYDLRFAALYRALAHSGAQILSVPAAFAMATGRAHWDVLLRARAIETGCYVIAPAQCGVHPSRCGRVRHSFGHSMIVNPWGEVVGQAQDSPEIIYGEIDIDQVNAARRRVPSLEHDRPFEVGSAP